MLKVTITCTECFAHHVENGVATTAPLVLSSQEFKTYKELAFGIQALLVACHSKSPHAPHQMAFRVDGVEEGLGEPKQLTISCKQMACRADTKTWSSTVPIELVGAMTLMFHTGHEGHALEITWDGTTWSTPG